MNEVNPKHVVREDEVEGQDMVINGMGGLRRRGRLAKNSLHDELSLAEMKARITSLWKQQKESYIEIAEKVSDEFGLEGEQRLNFNNIHYHIKAQMRQWNELSRANVDERMAAILTRYDQLDGIALDAYIASMQGRSTYYHKKQVDKARGKEREKWIIEQIKAEREQARDEGRMVDPQILGDLEEILITTQERTEEFRRDEDTPAGDPRWVAMMVDINDKRAKLWNLYRRDDGIGNADQEAARMSDDDRRARITAMLNQALQKNSLEQVKKDGTAALSNYGPLPKKGQQQVTIDIEAVEVPQVEEEDEFFSLFEI